MPLNKAIKSGKSIESLIVGQKFPLKAVEITADARGVKKTANINI